ncbi:MAG TPA: GntR family transcriptional regulator [Caldimonas sp.]|nr:GntR family transcriptional regulator [Caldimonas sp.]HEX2542085.1 GntR family transcriptional regulator [Caldimonas sp.]
MPPVSARAKIPRAPPLRSSLSEQAFDRLEEMIVTLQLPPGSLWSEAALSEALGIGRTPVREAVQRLAEFHLVVIMRRHGIRIAEVNEQEQLLVLETRRELERLISVRAARRASSADKQAMAAMAQALIAAGKAGDVLEMLRQYFAAKKFMARCAGNRFSEQAIAPLYTLSRRFYFTHYGELNDVVVVARLHADLLRAVATGDEEKAGLASDRQIDYAEEFAKRIITRGF